MRCILVLMSLFATPLMANPFSEARDFCWAHQTAFNDEGVEMPTGPIAVAGDSWTITWGNGKTDTLRGDKIRVPFSDGAVTISGQNARMADHVLTIAMSRDEGREPFVVRYKGGLFMTIPYPATTQDAEPWCFTVPLGT